MTTEEIVQYVQCAEDWRLYTREMWQLPTITIAVSAGIVSIAYYSYIDTMTRVVILLFGALMLISLTFAFIKHRVFHDERTEFLKRTEEEWIKRGVASSVIHRMTHEIEGLQRYRRVRAYNTLLIAMSFATAAMVALASYNIILFLSTLIAGAG